MTYFMQTSTKGGEPRVVWASEFGMSPQDCARAYVSCFNNYHMQETWDYKFKKRWVWMIYFCL